MSMRLRVQVQLGPWWMNECPQTNFPWFKEKFLEVVLKCVRKFPMKQISLI